MARFLLALALAGAASASFQFLSIGDWGDTAAKEVAPQMAKYSPEFVLALGDNFYDNGVSGVDDPQFKSKFEDTFTGASLQVPWYVCSGNHDYYGGSKGIEAEIAYTKHSDRWYYPDYYYAKDISMADGTTIKVVSTDTWRLNGGDTYVMHDLLTGNMALRNASRIRYEYATGVIDKLLHDVLLRQFEEEKPEAPITVRADNAQLAWIEQQLADSTADWNIVIGHFPVHSATTGEHGDTKSLISQLQPILEKYNVDMYMNGHDHVLQHIQLNGVNYFGSGAGAREHSGMNSHYNGLKGYSAGKYGFMMHSGSKSALTTTFITSDGGQPYTYTITKSTGTLSKMVESASRWFRK